MNLVKVEDIPIGQDVDITNLDHIVKLYGDMIDFARENGYPLGVSAVQLGIPEKFFIARCSMYPYGISDVDYGYIGYINCEYLPPKVLSEIISVEGCLSLPGRIFAVKRFPSINLKGYMMSVDIDTFSVETLKVDQIVSNKELSAILQHEIDHQNGILISDLGNEIV